MGDRVGVMSAGRLEQIAPPAELYDRPRTRFVAEFVGLTNRVAGVAHGTTVDVLGAQVPLLEGSAGPGPVTALVRPESVRLTPEADGAARVIAVSFLGSVCRAQVRLPHDEIIVAQMAAAEVAGLAPGTAVRVSILPAPIFAVAD